MLLPLIQGVMGAKEKKAQEQQAQRAAAARGEALRNVGNEGGGMSGILGAAGGMLGGNALGGQKSNALDDVDDALGSFDQYKGY